MTPATIYSFEAKITSRGYHVYKSTTWDNAKEGDEVQAEIKTNKDSIKVDPYAFAIRVQVGVFLPQKQLEISQKKFLDMFISSLKKKKTRSLEKFFL